MKPIAQKKRLYLLKFLRGAKASPAGAGGGLMGSAVMVVKLDESGKHALQTFENMVKCNY